MTKYFNHKNIILFTLLVASYFSIFLHLGTDPIHLWDEGTYAVNAYEMHLDHDYLVKHYAGMPEMWATNPPLVCYFQTLCIKLLGPSEVAIRLPSALAALGVILLIIRFALKEMLGIDFAAYAVFALLSAKGYISYHVTRTGDLDSVLIFFITGSIMYFYKFIEYTDKKIKYLFIFSVFLLFGYFTKGIASFLILPAFFIYALLKNKILYVLKTKQLYLCIFSILLLIFLYYYLRELRTPGYISFMLKSEVGRWYTENSQHSHPFFYYIMQMYEQDFKYFILLIPALIIFYFFLPKEHFFKRKGTIWLISAITFLLVISSSETKLEWYDGPLYPMLSIFMALGLKSIINFQVYPCVTSFVSKGVLIIALFAVPYNSIVQDNLTLYKGWHDVKLGVALKQYDKMKNMPKRLEMLVTGYNGHALFYKMLYNDKYGYDINIRDVAGNITMTPGIVYLFTHPAIFDYLKQTFNYEVLMDKDGMFVVKTLNYKIPPL